MTRTLAFIAAIWALLVLSSCQSVAEREAVKRAEARIWAARFQALGSAALAFGAIGFAATMSQRNSERRSSAAGERKTSEAALVDARKQLANDLAAADHDKLAAENAISNRAELEARAVAAFDKVRERETHNGPS